MTAGLAFTREMFIAKAEQKAAVRRVERILQLQGRGQRNLLSPEDSADVKEKERGRKEGKKMIPLKFKPSSYPFPQYCFI